METNTSHVVYTFRGNKVLVNAQTGDPITVEVEGMTYLPNSTELVTSDKRFVCLNVNLAAYCEEKSFKPKERHMRVPPVAFDMLMAASREAAREKARLAKATDSGNAEARAAVKPEPVHKMSLETVAQRVYDALVAASITNPRVRFFPTKGKLVERIEVRFEYASKKGGDKQASLTIFPTRTANGFTWRYALTEPRDLSTQGLGNLAQQGYERKLFATAMAAVTEAKQFAE